MDEIASNQLIRETYISLRLARIEELQSLMNNLCYTELTHKGRQYIKQRIADYMTEVERVRDELKKSQE